MKNFSPPELRNVLLPHIQLKKNQLAPGLAFKIFSPEGLKVQNPNPKPSWGWDWLGSQPLAPSLPSRPPLTSRAATNHVADSSLTSFSITFDKFNLAASQTH